MAGFIPIIWSQNINLALRKLQVGVQFVNRDYEGEISAQGNTVRITRPNAVTIGNYTGADIALQTADGESTLDLVIDQAKFFGVYVDDLKKAQANVDVMAAYTDEANYKLRDVADKFIFGMYADAPSENIIDTIVLTKDNIYSTLVDLATKLSEANVPLEGRKLALSPAEVGLLSKSPEFVKASPTGDQTVANSFVGTVAGFQVFMTNNLVQDDPTTLASGDDIHRYVVAAHPMACTYADQIVSVEQYRPEKKFGDAVKGLHVYGKKVIKPEAIAVIKVKIGEKA